MEHRKGREEAWRAASLGQGVRWVRDGMEHLLLSQLIKLPPDSASKNPEGGKGAPGVDHTGKGPRQ